MKEFSEDPAHSISVKLSLTSVLVQSWLPLHVSTKEYVVILKDTIGTFSDYEIKTFSLPMPVLIGTTVIAE